MKERKVMVVLLIVIMIISSVSVAQQTEVKVSIDGDYVNFNDATGYPFIDNNNRIQVPFRVTLEAIGANVSWQDESKVGIAEKNDIKIEACIGKPYILKNGERVMNDTIAVIKNDRVYLPIGIVMKSFGYDVSWNSEEKIVEIVNGNLETEEPRAEKPKVTIKSPSKTNQEEVTIKIITDKENVVYLNGDRIELNDNDEYVVKLPDLRNKFKVEVVNSQGIKIAESFTIERELDEVYLYVTTEEGRVDHKWLIIEGETNPGNIVKIDGKSVQIDARGEFEYRFTNLQPKENTIIVSAENTELDGKIEKEINIFYEVSQSRDSSEEENHGEEYTDTTHEDADSDYEEPVIRIDTDIPEITNEATLTISGTVENADYISFFFSKCSRAVKVEISEDNRFSYTGELHTAVLNEDGKAAAQQTDKGIYNHIQIVAKNQHKITVKQYDVYYKE